MKRCFPHHRLTLVRHEVVSIIVVLAGMTIDVAAGDQREFLDVGEVAGITAGSAVVLTMGTLAEKSAAGKRPRWSSPVCFEGTIQRTLGGRYYPDKTNFLDGSKGSAMTAIGGSLLLVSADLAWSNHDAGAIAAEDMFLFVTGIAATKGVTSIAKGLVRRQRPMVVLEPELAGRRSGIDHGFDNQSFFSGHSSSAFFASTFLNLRLRAILRQELSPEEYRKWRWAPPTLLFSWASFVGWSRIHAYKHFFLDVLVGAVTGALMAELFYSFQKDGDVSFPAQETGARRVFQISVRF